MRKAAAAVSMGTYSAWESTATLRLLGGARRGRRGTGAYVSPRAQFCYGDFLQHKVGKIEIIFLLFHRHHHNDLLANPQGFKLSSVIFR